MIDIHEGTERAHCCVDERNFPIGTVAPHSGILRKEGFVRVKVMSANAFLMLVPLVQENVMCF